MRKQTVNIAIFSQNGIVQKVGTTAMLQPKPQFKGGSVKWYEDKKKADK